METRLKACCVADILADAPENCFAFFILTGERGCETLATLLFTCLPLPPRLLRSERVGCFPNVRFHCAWMHIPCLLDRETFVGEVRWLGRIHANVGESFAWKERGEEKK